jgi:outer membrane protein assembly factor BamE (lipoprotein component of BamABCDE complex)
MNTSPVATIPQTPHAAPSLVRTAIATTLAWALITTGIVLVSVGTSGCATASANRADLSNAMNASSDAAGTNLTVGKVQREIRKGMSGAEVAEALGSPNIVTKDENGLETWVYDRIASEVTYSQSQSALLFFVARGDQSGSVAATQRTLTVVVKLNNARVENFSYHATKF